MIQNDFDPARRAFINPDEAIGRVAEMPEGLIAVFSLKMVTAYVNRLGGEQIAELKSTMGTMPIYRCTWTDGTVFALLSMPVGGPCAAASIEEAHAMGAQKFIALGSCGALNHEITAGHILVPEAAVRDEGTSYHYLPAADEIALDPACVAAVCAALEEIGAPYVRTKAWTTDAFYRETEAKIEKRLKQGCAVVEMECASMAAVSAFRGLKFAQILWAADSLAGEAWDKRNLSQHGMGAHEIYMEAAVRALKKL